MSEQSVSLIVVLLGGLLGFALLVTLLRFLQKRLRIFTKGTIAFMVSVLMLTTLISVLDLFSDIQDNEQRVKRRARTQVVSTFLHDWFADRDILRNYSGDEGLREQIEEAIEEIEEELERHTGSPNPPLISLTIHDRSDFIHPGVWEYIAILDNDRKNQLLCLEGRIQTGADSYGTRLVTNLEGEVTNRRYRNMVRVFQQANDYQNNDYRIDYRTGKWRLRRVSDLQYR